MSGGGGGGGGPDDRDEMIEAQRTVIGILFEVVKRLQANSDLDEEYMRIIASGRAGGRSSRLDEIAAERKGNAEVAARLLRQLEQ